MWCDVMCLQEDATLRVLSNMLLAATSAPEYMQQLLSATSSAAHSKSMPPALLRFPSAPETLYSEFYAVMAELNVCVAVGEPTHTLAEKL